MSNRASLGGGYSDIFGPSDALWGDLPTDFVYGFKDRNIGWGLRDDFTNFANQVVPSSSLAYYSSEGNFYKSFEIAGGGSTTQGITPVHGTYTVPTGMPIYAGSQGANNPGLNSAQALYNAGDVIPTPGQIVFTPTSASDQLQLQLAPNNTGTVGGAFTPYAISSGRQGAVYFECRLKLSGLLTGFSTFFVGLAGTLVVATSVPCATTSFSTVPSLLGFGCKSTDTGGQICMVYDRAGGTVSPPVGAPAPAATALCTVGATPTYTGQQVVGNAQYFKLGFKFDPKTGVLLPFVNGIAQDGNNGNGPNKTLGPSITTGTGWPNDVMTFAAGLFQTSTTYQTLTLDWWQACQLAG